MKKFISIILSFVFAITVYAQHVPKTLNWDGIDRDYLEYLPASYTGETSIPVIFCLHGLGDNMQNFSGVGFNYLPGNWIVITPQALMASLSGYEIGTAWNSGAGAELPFFGYTVLNAEVDDAGFLIAILDSLENNYNINTDSVFFMGFSMGGFMSQKMAVLHGDRITAIASVSGTLGSDVTEMPQVPMNVLHFHGTADSQVQYEDAGFNSGMGYYSVGLGAEQTVEYWRSYNNCDMEPVVTYFPNIRDDGKTFERYLYLNGTNETYTAFVKVIGGDHEWYYAPQNDIDYTTEIFKFFTNNMDFPTGLATATAKNIHVYPNPASDFISIECNTNAEVKILDITGKLVKQLNIGDGATTIQVSELSSGLYVLQIQSGSNITSSRFEIVR